MTKPYRIAVPIVLVGVSIALLTAAFTSFSNPSPATASAPRVAPPTGSSDELAIAIAKAQIQLRAVPKDDQTWAELGAAYVQQARVVGDPTYYPKAAGALERSMALNPTDNWQAMVGLGSLANARHQFVQARTWAARAQAVNAYNSSVYGVLDDALTQLGDYSGATAALQRMLDLQPGIPAFTRASYQFEEHGQVSAARDALQQALGQATAPADVAFCRYYLGELSFNEGDPGAALEQYQIGLEIDPSYDPLLAGRAKAEAALGLTTAALADYTTVISRVPQPQYVLEDAELLESLDRPAQAAQQFQLLAVEQKLLAANGVVDDLTSAVVDADHGSATAAVSHGRAEWSRRKSVLVADALGWALHRAGQDREALRYATEANRLGWHNATFDYHLGMIEMSLGRRGPARRDLAAALQTNPYFSPLQAPLARKALASLQGAR